MYVDIKEEVTTKKELDKYIKNYNIEIPEYSPAVVILLTDKDGKIILQRRGPKSRDEENRLLDIGGAVEEDDDSFRDALIREIREEAGEEFQYMIDKYVGSFLFTRFDIRTNKDVNWLFFVYKGTIINGELKINEPGKSLGYEYVNYENFDNLNIASSTKIFWDYYMKGMK